MNPKKKILFLYTELAEYTVACINALRLAFDGEIHVVRWTVNKEAPFQFKFPNGVRIYDRQNFTTKDLLKLSGEIRPSVIICSGWIDKGYMAVVKQEKQRASTVLALDNHWTGNLKQRLATVASKLYLKNRFTHVWVPGIPQATYAKKLGFNSNKILSGFYSADYDKFYKHGANALKDKSVNFPKRFIYVGRYVKHKGIYDLWNAFVQLQQEQPNDWELWCLGTGELYEDRIRHEKIKHFGFVQPDEMESFVKETGIFILPSHFEPWGVVLHEFAAAGFPLISSDKVGAATAFLEDGVNGYQFAAGNIQQLKESMKKFMKLSPKNLLEMGKNSNEKACRITPGIWAKTLISLID